MTRRALANMFFPDKSPVEAVRSLRMWIVHCPDLVAALEELGQPYKKTKILPCCQDLGLLVWLTYFLQGGNEVGTVDYPHS